MDIEFLHTPTEEEPFAVIIKPRGTASAPLYEGDPSAYTQAASRFPELNLVKGKKECEHGLIHRIDTDTEGLLLIASSQDFYDYMAKIQEEGKFIKSYKAICSPLKGIQEGYPKSPLCMESIESSKSISVLAKSMFRPYGIKNREVRPVTSESGKAAQKKASPAWYSTDITLKQKENNTFTADCILTKGYRHQVRCHLAWLGFPIEGDPLYSADEKAVPAKDFKFWASKIQFPLKTASGVIQKVFEYEPKNAPELIFL
ncbi:MAG: RNA pseudouridine synthase [Treponema sp.]|nr:RNA pseudouridine synthase [Treponema sp.]